MRSHLNTLLTGAACLLAAAPSAGQAPPMAGEEFRVNQHDAGIQQSASIALDASGNFVVAWQSEVPGHGDEIRARRFDARGAAQSAELAVNVESAGQQDAPAVAMANDGSFVVVWQTIVQSNLEVRARRFDPSGAPRGGEIAINMRSGNANSAPAVALDARGDFVVVWESSIDGSYEIRARRFDASGAARGGEIGINAEAASSQRGPALALAADGAFIVAWRSNVEGSFEIRARRFDASGTAASEELVVNTTRAGDQVAPAVAIAPDGGFVIAWENAFDNSYDVRARRFGPSGVATSAELSVQPGTNAQQFAPALAMAQNGAYLVAWQSFTAGDLDVRARSFASDGTPLSASFCVNALASGDQKSPALAMNASGTFAAAWHSDASGHWDIAARTGRLRPTPRGKRACPKPPAASCR